jgi:putative flippase GtrA
LSRARELRILARYVAVGAATSCIGLAAYYALTFGFGFGPELALATGTAVAFGPAYALNRSWTFGSTTRHRSGVWRYAAGYLAAYAFQGAFLWLGVDALGLPHQYVVLVGFGLAALLFFVLQRLWVFERWRGGPVRT